VETTQRAAASTALAEFLVLGVLTSLAPSGGGPLLLSMTVPAAWIGTLFAGRAAYFVTICGVGLYALAGCADDLLSGRPATDPMQVAHWMVLGLLVTATSQSAVRVHERRAEAAAGYDKALVLLRELRSVTRRLPIGLDRRSVLEASAARIRAIRPDAEVTVYTRVDRSWVAEFGTPVPAGQAVGPGSDIWKRTVNHQRPLTLPTHPSTPLTWTLVPLTRRRNVVCVLAVRCVDGRPSRQEVQQMARAVSALPAQLEASAQFQEVRERAVAEERSRVSRQIHDGVAQDLAAVAYQIDALELGLASPQDRQSAAAVSAEVRRLLEELRFSIFDLRTEIDEGERLGTVLASYARQVGDRGGLRVTVATDDRYPDPPPHVTHEIMRIAQEAVTNARRHAQAQALWVRLLIDADGLMLRIADDGRGIDPEHGYRTAGEQVGLSIMRERAERLGAVLIVRPRVGGGTVVECRLDTAHLRVDHATGDAVDALDAGQGALDQVRTGRPAAVSTL
jgi:signal transduction histidine kinase